MPSDAELLSRKFTTAIEALKYDEQVLSNLKRGSDTAVSDAETCVELLNNLRNPTNSYGPYVANRMSGDALAPFFNRKIEEFDSMTLRARHARWHQRHVQPPPWRGHSP